jgi:hypothetical protein
MSDAGLLLPAKLSENEEFLFPLVNDNLKLLSLDEASILKCKLHREKAKVNFILSEL